MTDPSLPPARLTLLPSSELSEEQRHLEFRFAMLMEIAVATAPKGSNIAALKRTVRKMMDEYGARSVREEIKADNLIILTLVSRESLRLAALESEAGPRNAHLKAGVDGMVALEKLEEKWEASRRAEVAVIDQARAPCIAKTPHEGVDLVTLEPSSVAATADEKTHEAHTEAEDEPQVVDEVADDEEYPVSQIDDALLDASEASSVAVATDVQIAEAGGKQAKDNGSSADGTFAASHERWMTLKAWNPYGREEPMVAGCEYVMVNIHTFEVREIDLRSFPADLPHRDWRIERRGPDPVPTGSVVAAE